MDRIWNKAMEIKYATIKSELTQNGLVEGSELFKWAFNQMCNGVANMSHADWIAYKIESDHATQEKIYSDCN